MLIWAHTFKIKYASDCLLILALVLNNGIASLV